MITKTRDETEMPKLPSCSSVYERSPTHVQRCTEQQFRIDGVGENDPHKIKIDDDCDSVCSCAAIPLPFYPLNKTSPSQCLIGETDKLSRTNEVGIDEASVPQEDVHCAVSAVSVGGNISPIPDPAMLKLIAKSGESGCIEGSSLSATRCDDSNSEDSSNSSDSDEMNDELTYTGVTHLEATDDDQSPPNSLDESTPNNGATEIVIANIPPCFPNFQATGIPSAPAKEKEQGAGKSRTKQQKKSESAVEPIEETACRSMGACAVPAPSQPPSISSDSEGKCAEEDGAVESLSNDAGPPNQSSQDQDESTSATSTSVGEPPTEVEMHHGEQDFTMVTARPGTFPGGDILITLQMFVMEPQSPPQPEMWHLPVEESEEGRNEPSKLVHGHITWNIK